MSQFPGAVTRAYAVGAMTRPIGRRPVDAWFATISNQNG